MWISGDGIQLPPFTPVRACFQPVAGPGQLSTQSHGRDPLSHTIYLIWPGPIPFDWLSPVSTVPIALPSHLLRPRFRLNSFSMTSASCSLHVSCKYLPYLPLPRPSTNLKYPKGGLQVIRSPPFSSSLFDLISLCLWDLLVSLFYMFSPVFASSSFPAIPHAACLSLHLHPKPQRQPPRHDWQEKHVDVPLSMIDRNCMRA